MTSFSELGLSKLICSTLKKCDFKQPTEIQTRAIPRILSGEDIMASAQTGSGKTAAYALPIIECLDEHEKIPRALVLVPTRELCIQVVEQFDLFCKNRDLQTVMVYGGVAYDKQVDKLKKGTDVIVATPGRLLDLLESNSVNLSNIEILVLDEADRLLDMGFMPQIRRIIANLSKERQTLMFSATFDNKVQSLAAQYLNDPFIIRINVERIEAKEIDQHVYHVHEFDKDDLLLKLIQGQSMESVLIFTRTKRKAGWVKDRLRASNVPAEEIHGDISQAQREKTLAKYRQGKFNVLVATDVAARGLDVPQISHVVNYDLPNSPEDYVHRIGRTGRAGKPGVAFSFVSQEDKYLVRDIEKYTGRVLDHQAAAEKTVKAQTRRSAAAWA